MEPFTPEQCQAVARQYQQLSLAILHKRLFFIKSGVPPEDPSLLTLQSQQNTLGDISNEYALKAAALTLSHAEQAAAKISESLQRAQDALRTLNKIDRAISIASDAINLSVAIYTGDFDQIAAAAEALREVSI